MLSVVSAAAKAAPPPPKSIVDEAIDYVTDAVMPVWDASLAGATDIVGLLMGLPKDVSNVFVYFVGIARNMPGFARSFVSDVAKVGDSFDSTGSLNALPAFAAKMASIVFSIYVGLLALNLALGVGVAVKDYFSGYLTLPTSLPVVGRLPPPVMKVRNMLQTNILDRIKRLAVVGWIVPLEGQTGAPSLKQALPVLANVTSTCVLLGCAPNIANIIQNGANKNASEALVWTLGMAVGLNYLVKRL